MFARTLLPPGAPAQRLREVRTGTGNRGHQPEHESRENRYESTEATNSIVKADLVRSWENLRSDLQQEVETPEAENETGCASNNRKKQALSKELPNNLKASRTQSGTD